MGPRPLRFCGCCFYGPRLFFFFFCLDGSDTPAKRKMEAIRAERGYAHADEVACSAAAMGDDFPAKCAMFYEEHLHEDEEIRYVRGRRLSPRGPCPALLLRDPVGGVALQGRRLLCLSPVLWRVCCGRARPSPSVSVPVLLSVLVGCSHSLLRSLLMLFCGRLLAALPVPFGNPSMLVTSAASPLSPLPPLHWLLPPPLLQVRPRGRRLL